LLDRGVNIWKALLEGVIARISHEPEQCRNKAFQPEDVVYLIKMLTSDKKAQWQQNGKAYVANTDVFSRAEKAADIIEKVAS
jgi:hypothetical protein